MISHSSPLLSFTNKVHGGHSVDGATSLLCRYFRTGLYERDATELHLRRCKLQPRFALHPDLSGLQLPRLVRNYRFYLLLIGTVRFNLSLSLFSRTSISRPSSSWVDDYIDYLNVPSCCRVTDDGEFCPSSDKQCASCDRTIEGIRPDRETFTEFFEWYLADLPDENCAKAGRAAYAAVSKRMA